MQQQLKNFLVIVLGVIAVIYLGNPTAGFFELIPDNLPVIGNLDEAGAVFIILSALRYYGVDLSRIFARELPDADTHHDDTPQPQ